MQQKIEYTKDKFFINTIFRTLWNKVFMIRTNRIVRKTGVSIEGESKIDDTYLSKIRTNKRRVGINSFFEFVSKYFNVRFQEIHNGGSIEFEIKPEYTKENLKNKIKDDEKQNKNNTN